MERRLTLHTKLREIVGDDVELYFQAPTGQKLSYPCVLYSIDNVHTLRADNQLYRVVPRYQITVMERDPEGTLAFDILNEFKNISFNTKFVKDSLYQTNLTLYF